MTTAAKLVQPIAIFFGLSHSTRCGIGIGWTNFAAVAMETKREDLK
jgi:hypothetical protein